MIEEMQTGIVCTVLSEMEIRMEQLAIFGGGAGSEDTDFLWAPVY